jgi:hypothetical protein
VLGRAAAAVRREVSMRSGHLPQRAHRLSVKAAARARLATLQVRAIYDPLCSAVAATQPGRSAVSQPGLLDHEPATKPLPGQVLNSRHGNNIAVSYSTLKRTPS